MIQGVYGLLRRIFGVNPARAGMIPVMSISAIMIFGKPRASGDDPLAAEAAVISRR